MADTVRRARELQELNEQLRRAQARDRKVALALQEAMLPTRRRWQATAPPSVNGPRWAR